MAYKTTKKDFEIFKKEAEKWLEYFGLKDWEWYWDHADISDSTARCQFNCTQKTLLFLLNTKPDHKPDLKLSAFHEVCEALLAPLTDIAFETYSSNTVTAASHCIIHRLENTIFKESL